MTGGPVEMLAAVGQSEVARVVSYSIALAVVLGLLVACVWLLVFDRRRDGAAPVVFETETDREEAACR